MAQASKGSGPGPEAAGLGPTGSSISRWSVWDYVRISAFALAISGIAGSFGSVVLPVRLLDFVPESLKNTYLGVLTFLGLSVAMATQPVAGWLSDVGRHGSGRRARFIIAGSLAACVALVAVGISPTYGALLAAYLFLQLSTNVAQAPYQAIIPDMVPEALRGRASAAKGVAETLGAVACAGLVAVPMDRYGEGLGSAWLWMALFVLAAVVLVTAAVTLWGIRKKASVAAPPSPATIPAGDPAPRPRAPRGLVWLLLSRFFGFMAVNSVGTFGLYVMRDYFGFENPASVMAALVIVVALCILVFTYPAGVFSDKVGRKVLLLPAAALGSLAFLWLLAFHSYGAILVAGAMLGTSTAVFYGVNWALATELVPAGRSGYYLGLINISVAGGSAVARLSGTAIDGLNSWHDGLGYTSLIGACAVYSLLSGLFLLKVPTPKRNATGTPRADSV